MYREELFMLKEFVLNHVFMSSILLVGLLSLMLQGLMTLSLKGYVKATANMKTTRKKIMLNLKNQFETIYGMDYQVRNIAAYVDKYLLKLRFLGLSYMSWERVPFLSAGVATLLAVAGTFYGYINGAARQAQAEILFAYGTVLACLFICFHIYGIKSKKQQIQIQLVDYLENYLTNRLMRTKEGSREWKILDEETENALVKVKGTAVSRMLQNGAVNKESEVLQQDKVFDESGEVLQQQGIFDESDGVMQPDEDTVDLDADMEMLKRLLRQVEHKESGGTQNKKEMETLGYAEVSQADSGKIAQEREAAVSVEIEPEEIITQELTPEESELELLEEFVQSFLA
jgi:hypothetical protein